MRNGVVVQSGQRSAGLDRLTLDVFAERHGRHGRILAQVTVCY
jgi:hypothetical protein